MWDVLPHYFTAEKETELGLKLGDQGSIGSLASNLSTWVARKKTETKQKIDSL